MDILLSRAPSSSLTLRQAHGPSVRTFALGEITWLSACPLLQSLESASFKAHAIGLILLSIWKVGCPTGRLHR